jgi:endonuclease YncB( thermonuclease family)
MVKAGLAEVYRGRHAKGFNPKIYQDAESEAVKEKRGMWVLGDKYISPGGGVEINNIIAYLQFWQNTDYLNISV